MSSEPIDTGRIELDPEKGLMEKIHELSEQALVINRTFPEGTHCKEGMKPSGFMPPDKRMNIIDILEEISKLTQHE